MCTQVSTWRIADLQFCEQLSVPKGALPEILNRLWMTRELPLIESNCLFEQICSRQPFLLQLRDTLTEIELSFQLDETNQVTTAPTAVTVEQVLAGVEVEGGMSFLVQRVKSDKLLLNTNALSRSVAPLQVLQ